MASLHRPKGRRFWYCAYRSADGNQHFKSTGTSNKAEAQILAGKLAAAGRLARRSRLTPDSAREIIESALKELLAESGHTLPRASVGEFFRSWLVAKEKEGSEGTFLRYEGIVARFLEYLGPRCEDALTTVGAADVAAFRDSLAGAVSVGTVNTYLKVLRVAFGAAVKRELTAKNPAALVETLKDRDPHERRAFSMPELKHLLTVADADWSTMILVGLYTGLRLQDIATLDWGNIDLHRKELIVTTGKTDRTQLLPIHPALQRHLETLAGVDQPDAPLCPTLRGNGSSWLSNQFYDLMTRAKLVPARTHQRKEEGEGRSRRRQLQAVSFHALRHTATSLLKNAGVSDAIARDIIGHESEAISRNYTHIDHDTKRTAIDKMPDIL